MTSATYAPLPFGTGDERVNGITVQPTAGEGSPITLEVGCYIDGHYGQYGADRLAEIADDLLGTDHAATMARYRAEGDEGDVDAWEARRELTDEIVDALNSATSGGYWEWCDGEFYLSATYCDDLGSQCVHCAIVEECEIK